MKATLRPLWALAICAVLAFYVGLALDLHGLRVAVKTIPALVLAVTCSFGAAEPGRGATVVGLVFCALGDLLLELSPDWFVFGVGAFLVGHLFFIVAFVRRDRTMRPALAIPFVLWGALLYSQVLPNLGALAVPVGVYVCVICTMMWRAASNALPPGAGSAVVGALGALSFGVSDSLIAISRFHTPFASARYFIIALYWLGLLGIALSSLRAGTDESATA